MKKIALSSDPLLVWNYGTMGVLAGIAGILFWISYRKLDAQEDELNELDTGHLERHVNEHAKGDSLWKN